LEASKLSRLIILYRRISSNSQASSYLYTLPHAPTPLHYVYNLPILGKCCARPHNCARRLVYLSWGDRWVQRWWYADWQGKTGSRATLPITNPTLRTRASPQEAT